MTASGLQRLMHGTYVVLLVSLAVTVVMTLIMIWGDDPSSESSTQILGTSAVFVLASIALLGSTRAFLGEKRD